MKYRLCTLAVFAMVSLLSVSPVRSQGVHRRGVEADIVRVLNRFQEGYTERDTSAVESYVHDLFSDGFAIVRFHLRLQVDLEFAVPGEEGRLQVRANLRTRATRLEVASGSHFGHGILSQRYKAPPLPDGA